MIFVSFLTVVWFLLVVKDRRLSHSTFQVWDLLQNGVHLSIKLQKNSKISRRILSIKTLNSSLWKKFKVLDWKIYLVQIFFDHTCMVSSLKWHFIEKLSNSITKSQQNQKLIQIKLKRNQKQDSKKIVLRLSLIL